MQALAIGGINDGQIINGQGDYDGCVVPRYGVSLTSGSPPSMRDVMEVSANTKRTLYVLKHITYSEAGEERTWWFWVDAEILESKRPMLSMFDHIFNGYRAVSYS